MDRESLEALNARVCDFVDQGIICTDEHFVITYANKWVETYSGRSSEYLLGKRIEDVFPELKKNNRISLYTLALQGNHIAVSHDIGEPLFLLAPSVEHPDITCMIQNVKIYPLINDRGICGTITMIKDVTKDFIHNKKLERMVTELRQAKSELIKSRELYKALVETISEILVICDERGIITYISPSVKAVVGLDPENVVGTPWALWVHPEDMPRVSRILSSLLKNSSVDQDLQQSNGVELRIRDSKDKWHYFEGIVNVITDGGIEGHLAISLRNVEQRKELEDRLKKEETFLRTILETVKILLIVLDSDGNVVLFNRACEEVTGYDSSEVIGNPIWDLLIPADQKEEVMEVFGELKRQSIPNVHENYWLTKDGKKVLISWSNSVITDERGNPQFIIGSGIDITEQRKLEDKLVFSSKQLMDQVHELEERNRMLATANQMNEILMAARLEDEIYKAASTFIPNIFSYLSGAFLVASQNEDVLTQHISWGKHLDGCSFVHVNDCWAIRTGRTLRCLHSGGCLCSNAEAVSSKGYALLCVPVIYGSTSFGILRLYSSTMVDKESEANIEKKLKFIENVALMIARMIGVALNNANLHRQLKDMSIKDPLTGLYNRRFMEETLSKEWHRAVREQRPLGVIMLDLDHFKKFNDTYGHLAGDHLLKYFGKFLLRHVRASDTPCRYGGEEFLIIMPGANVGVTTKRANFLRETFERELVPLNGNYVEGLTISGGVATFPESAKSMEEIIRLADEALYEAKKAGRNRIARAINDRSGIRFELISSNGDVASTNIKRIAIREEQEVQDHFQ